MATGQSDVTRIDAIPQAEVPGLGAGPWPPGAADAAPAATPDARRQAAGLPVSGAGPGRQDRDRQRYAWLYDDEDIWGADSVNCVPPVACGGDWRAPRA